MSDNNVINLAEWKAGHGREGGFKSWEAEGKAATWCEDSPHDATEAEDATKVFIAAWLDEFEEVRNEIHILLCELDAITRSR